MDLMLSPYDYGADALYDAATRDLMQKITFEHGGKEYDDKYPDGIPTSLVITTDNGETYDSGFIMYPSGHARNSICDLDGILSNKFAELGALAVEDVDGLLKSLTNLRTKSADEIDAMNSWPIKNVE